jgi:acetyl-CoA C-acetyltransferase
MTRSRVAVVSSAQTEMRTAWSGAQHIDLISAVVDEVFKGTGLDLDDVDFVIDSGSDVLDGRSISNCGFLGAMGAHHKEESRVEEDGLWAALYGATKIASGAADVGLIIAYSKPSESSVDAFYASQVDPFYQRPVGFDHRAASGLQAQRYLADHGLTTRDLARLVAARWQAAQGRNIEIARVPSVDEILAAGNLARPLTQLMMARPVDGAVAILLASNDVARRASRAPAWITGLGASSDRHAFASRKAGQLEACAAAARAAAARSGLDFTKASVAEVSASSAVTELMVLEAMGIVPAGRGITLLDGEPTVAVNRSGGALPADPIMATGLVRLAEAARQLAWPSEYGLTAPKSAIVHGAGGVGMQSHCVMTIEV